MQEPESDSAWDALGADLRDSVNGRAIRDRIGEFMLRTMLGRDDVFRITTARPFVKPVRAAVPPERKEQWMGQLAAGEPLANLVRSVPHGFKVRQRLVGSECWFDVTDCPNSTMSFLLGAHGHAQDATVLDLLAKLNVAMPRASWLIKVVFDTRWVCPRAATGAD